MNPAKSSQLDKNLSEAFALLKRSKSAPSSSSKSKRAPSKKSDRLVKLEAQLAEAFAILNDMGVSKRSGGGGSGREASIHNVHTLHFEICYYPRPKTCKPNWTSNVNAPP